MQQKAIIAPDSVYPPTADYSHALEVTDAKRLLFVSGTMGLDKNGQAPPSLEEQLRLVWSNLRAILAQADMTVENVMRVTSYLTDPGFAEVNAAARVQALGNRLVPTTAIVVQTLRKDWLIEIEIIAAA